MRARKRFGQNFLHDPRVIARIVDALDPQPQQRLVEIGPGRAALTAPVLARSGRLDVVEIDRDLAHDLRAREEAGLTVHEADALAFDFTALSQQYNAPLRVFGNLPYNISTPILFHLIEHVDVISDMLFMLQKEVVERIVAQPGNKTYGRLTIMLAVALRAESLFTIGPGAFVPAPKVESAIVRLTPLPQPLVDHETLNSMRMIVTQAFSQRRKTLRNALRGLVSAETMESCGLDPKQRPETVDPKQFAALAQSRL
ncbi:MAG: 16S rRNA (adenine(1518)-N(6)/adenine(1519)-N(6))-dimethyltransferase RsmA [Gammaproteobacteria bacterium]|nr:16S rRNA (adenine(1518)-N(6)/adenine(1519)-N(6))-dimethyltransferase RsmA [Gammaproteobacteria bacterium]